MVFCHGVLDCCSCLSMQVFFVSVMNIFLLMLTFSATISNNNKIICLIHLRTCFVQNKHDTPIFQNIFPVFPWFTCMQVSGRDHSTSKCEYSFLSPKVNHPWSLASRGNKLFPQTLAPLLTGPVNTLVRKYICILDLLWG